MQTIFKPPHALLAHSSPQPSSFQQHSLPTTPLRNSLLLIRLRLLTGGCTRRRRRPTRTRPIVLLPRPMCRMGTGGCVGVHGTLVVVAARPRRPISSQLTNRIGDESTATGSTTRKTHPIQLPMCELVELIDGEPVDNRSGDRLYRRLHHLCSILRVGGLFRELWGGSLKRWRNANLDDSGTGFTLFVSAESGVDERDGGNTCKQVYIFESCLWYRWRARSGGESWSRL